MGSIYRHICHLVGKLPSGTDVRNKLLECKAIDGYPGSGKTTEIITQAKTGDLVISRTSANVK